MSSIVSNTDHGNLDNKGAKAPFEFMWVSPGDTDPQMCMDGHLDNIIPPSTSLSDNIRPLCKSNSGSNQVLNLYKV